MLKPVVKLTTRPSEVTQKMIKNDKLQFRQTLLHNSIFLFIMLIATFIYSTGYAANSKTAKKNIKNNDQFSLENILLDDHLILNFVSHSKSLEHFRESQKKRQELTFLCEDKINQLKQAFPNSYQVALFEKRIEMAFSGLKNPLPYEDIFAPFLVYGLMDTSSIHDPNTLKEIQTIQVKIFKNWLARFHIGFADPNLFKEIRAYANRSALEIFSKIIGPILEMVEGYDLDYDDIIDLYTYDDHDEISDTYFEENSFHFVLDEDFIEKITNDLFSDVTFDEAAPDSQSIEAAANQIELLSTQIDEKYFYFNSIVNLFLKANNVL